MMNSPRMFRYLMCCCLCFALANSTLYAQNCVIEHIQFDGSSKTDVNFLKSLLDSKEGAAFSQELMDQDMTRLVRLPAIAKATYSKGKKESDCTVVIKLIENRTLIPAANFFKTTDEEIAYSFGLFEHNLFKKSISLGGWYQKNIFDSYGLSMRAPYLFSANFGLSTTVQNLSTQEPVFFPQGMATYQYTNRSAEVLALYQFNFNHRLDFGINIFKEIYESQDLSDIPDAPTSFEVDKILFKAVYTYDNLSYDYQYVSGIKSNLFLQYVLSDTEVNNNFLIAWNDFHYFKRLGGKGNWATRLRVGLSSNDETPFAPFSVDNNLNLRGVGNIIDRGTGVVVMNTEYRHTLAENNWCALQSNIFVDAGTWRNPGGDFNDFVDSDNVRIFPGVGLRFIHKKIFNLVLRIDYGYGITEGEPNGVVFGVGQYF